MSTPRRRRRSCRRRRSRRGRTVSRSPTQPARVSCRESRWCRHRPCRFPRPTSRRSWPTRRFRGRSGNLRRRAAHGDSVESVVVRSVPAHRRSAGRLRAGAALGVRALPGARHVTDVRGNARKSRRAGTASHCLARIGMAICMLMVASPLGAFARPPAYLPSIVLRYSAHAAEYSATLRVVARRHVGATYEGTYVSAVLEVRRGSTIVFGPADVLPQFRKADMIPGGIIDDSPQARHLDLAYLTNRNVPDVVVRSYDCGSECDGKIRILRSQPSGGYAWYNGGLPPANSRTIYAISEREADGLQGVVATEDEVEGRGASHAREGTLRSVYRLSGNTWYDASLESPRFLAAEAKQFTFDSNPYGRHTIADLEINPFQRQDSGDWLLDSDGDAAAQMAVFAFARMRIDHPADSLEGARRYLPDADDALLARVASPYALAYYRDVLRRTGPHSSATLHALASLFDLALTAGNGSPVPDPLSAYYNARGQRPAVSGIDALLMIAVARNIKRGYRHLPRIAASAPRSVAVRFCWPRRSDRRAPGECPGRFR